VVDRISVAGQGANINFFDRRAMRLPHKCFLKRRMSKSGADLPISLVELEEMINRRGAEKV